MIRHLDESALNSRQSIGWFDGYVRYLDQRILPHEITVIETDEWQNIYDAIKTLAVRGAPLIGISAAYGVAVAVHALPLDRNIRKVAIEVIDSLAQARPTAVNLTWALNKMRLVVDNTTKDDQSCSALLEEAVAIHDDDILRCERMAAEGQTVVPDGSNILTVCNTGFLATGGIGTAASIFYRAFDLGKKIHVYACETRPLLQGARLTVWEMSRANIPVTLMVDSAAAGLARDGNIDVCIIGADRVAANGDVANKIGSYQLALACKANDVPFYVAAPWSTIDTDCPDGDHIPIEERAAEEVTKIDKNTIHPDEISVYNPAFDRVPANLVSGIITEKGIHTPPYKFIRESK